ncbi:MAG: shikimate dehydrogenase [Gammaproteobacteria bacterium]|nr:shikimate dehydrogenase [Gammaproteobacteria bacterium]MYD80733.1 shikimate dehydrogenase [Gammaproteobacteria bacterium]
MSRDRYAVIGNPVAHSLSPKIHALFAQHTGEELEFSRLHSPPDEFDTSASSFFGRGGLGLSVTAPFKNDAFHWVDRVDVLARECGAVNTIVYRDGETTGYNTDGLGLKKDLERLGWLKQGARILVLGAGGAASGVLGPLLREGCLVTVANRTESKLSNLKERFPDLSMLPLSEAGGSWDIVINATSAFLHGESLQFDLAITSKSRCYDLSYQSDGLTGFVVASQQNDARAVSDGLGMLVFQAAEAFSLWRNVELENEVASNVLSRLRS